MGKAHMGHAARPEKGLIPRERAVDVLIYNDKIAGNEILSQAADSRNRHYIRAAKPFQRIDIGAVIDRTGGMHMAPPVTRQKGHGNPV